MCYTKLKDIEEFMKGRDYTVNVCFYGNSSKNIKCNTYIEAMKTALPYTDNYNVSTIRIFNEETMEMQFISDYLWKGINY